MIIDIREIRQVATVAKEGGFAKASKVLHISQPALSRSIQEIERKSGFRLFERGREGARLTDAGRSFLQQAGEILTLAENFERDLAQIKGLGKGDLYIGAGLFASQLFMGEALAHFARENTEVRIRIVTDLPDSLIHRLRRREVDFAVADPSWAKPATDVTETYLDPHQGHLVVRAGHPLLGKKNIPIEELVTYPLVTMGIAPGRIAQMGEHLTGGEAKIHSQFAKWPPAIAVNCVASMKTIAANSDGVTMLSLKMIRHELERGELAVLPLFLPWLKPRLAIMRLNHRTLSPLADAAVKAIIAEDKKTLRIEQSLEAKWLKPRKARRPKPA
jgi:DNA-binding transcriptional LysR family regulator